MEKKSNHLVGSIICGILTAFAIVSGVISLFGRKWVISDIVFLVLSVFVVFYAFVGYKKPHGNLLKYIILLFAAANIPCIIPLAQIGSTVFTIWVVIFMCVLCYIAGRLDKVKKNLILMIILTVVSAITGIVQIVSGAATIGMSCSFIVWLDICVAYFLRYKEHKEAGLADAPKK